MRYDYLDIGSQVYDDAWIQQWKVATVNLDPEWVNDANGKPITNTFAYYAAHGYESAGGRRLAECLSDELPPELGGGSGPPAGMALAVLRETRMPAVVCELGPPAALVEHGPRVAAACARAFTCWVEGLSEV